MEIKQLDKKEYAGRKFIARYKTNGYYDICPDDNGFTVRYECFGSTVERSFEDVFFAEWLEDSVAFGAFENGELIGFAECAPESWNNRFRISNICVFGGENRGRGVGTALMHSAESAARKAGARMLVLETQTCNEKAIAFYKKNGFSIIGFDLYSYSNDDPARHEVRIEMGKRLK